MAPGRRVCPIATNSRQPPATLLRPMLLMHVQRAPCSYNTQVLRSSCGSNRGLGGSKYWCLHRREYCTA